ncbi:MAG: helix-turn-helix transcriptional regulator [Treponemataceae bacterium]|nr:helix-turn-helix transcriptional regulator [Spirochaetales bacterium]MDY6032056.1 helix-turn-helix transcriptional regulator [Treponemataceae bacterium]
MFGDQIKNLRMSKCLNQVEMAKILGVTKQSVSNWENENIMPSVDMLIKLSQFFNVSTDYLLGLTEKHALNTEGLSEIQIAHIQNIINDIRES